MIDQGSVPSLMGSTVRDSTGEKVGKVAQVYLDDVTGQPEWVTVRTGLFGTKESFVPLAAARVDGDELVVDVPKDRVTGAPKIDEDGHLSEEQEAELYSYYGVSPGLFGQDSGRTDGYAETSYPPAATTDDGAPGPATTRPPAEQLRPEAEEARRARLRRYAAPGTGPAGAPASGEEPGPLRPGAPASGEEPGPLRPGAPASGEEPGPVRDR